MVEISINSVSKNYKSGLFKKTIQAVKELSFQVYQGEVIGLIGPNGAGKSTLIRMVMGLIKPDTGSVLFRGELNNASQVSIQKEIGYLPENPYLYDHLTLSELLTFCGRTSGLDSMETKKRGSLLMGKLNLIDVQKRPLRTFSKGMLQRAGICFALLHDPSIVIFDEPMSGLDPVGRKMVFDLVLELKSQGKTIFFCSHILNDVERLCDRIGLINKGCLISEFQQKDFLQSLGKTIFIFTSCLSTSQVNELKALLINIREEGDGHLLAVNVEDFYEVSSYLGRAGVQVRGTREEWLTLENLFMQSIEGA